MDNIFLQSLLCTVLLCTTLPSTASDDSCLLKLLPDDVLNHIATFLEFEVESDAECIERIKNQQSLLAHTIILPHHRTISHSNNKNACFGDPALERENFSPDQSKLVFLTTCKEDNCKDKNSRCRVLDIKTNTLVKNVFSDNNIYNILLKNNITRIRAVALSHTGSHIAEVQTLNSSGFTLLKDILFVRNHKNITKPRQFVVLEYKPKTRADGCSYYYPTFNHAIGFNKQSTKIIVCCTQKNENTLKFETVVRVFPLVKPRAQTLETYFRNNLVCKKL